VSSIPKSEVLSVEIANTVLYYHAFVRQVVHAKIVFMTKFHSFC